MTRVMEVTEAAAPGATVVAAMVATELQQLSKFVENEFII